MGQFKPPLLEHTDRNATEAALDVGFQNYNHFAAQFRKLYHTNLLTEMTL
nr:helix-turn-helix domain-containing protein [Brevibacillus daliensis]